MEARGPGAVVLFGSGETGPLGCEALRWLAASGRTVRNIAVLETPAGFEPNADAVARRWPSFLRRQPEAQDAELLQLPLRRRGTVLGTDDPEAARPLLRADLIVLGAGSPSYTVRQLQGSVAWSHAEAAHLLGASFFLASAAAIAVGTCALPVYEIYEIYKVGEDPHWKEGLRLFGAYGLALAVVTHWDNKDGGASLDTSRCYMGRDRFDELLALLHEDVVVVGIDEHTALALDPATSSGRVLGRGGVTVICAGRAATFSAGERFPLGALGPFSPPSVQMSVPDGLARSIRQARSGPQPSALPPDVAALVASRDEARAHRDWQAADRLRRQIVDRGWRIEDAPEGPRVFPLRLR